MGRKGVDCGCGAREDLYDRIAALRQRIEVLETEINQVESEFPGVLGDVRDAKASAVAAAASASASAEAAEASAVIAEGYEERLGAVEEGVVEVNDLAEEIDGDVTALKGRVGHAEDRINDAFDYAEAIGDDVAAIDTEIHTTRPYMTTNTEQTVTGTKHIPTATASDDSDVAVNKAFVQATDGRNNIVHNIGDEEIDGTKTYIKVQKILNVGYGYRIYFGSQSTRWYEVYRLKKTNTDRYTIDINGAVNGLSSICHGRIYIVVYANATAQGGWVYRFAFNNEAYIVGDVCALVDNEDNTVSVYFKLPAYAGVDLNIISAKEQSNFLPPSAVKMRSEFTPNDMETLPDSAFILQNMTQR